MMNDEWETGGGKDMVCRLRWAVWAGFLFIVHHSSFIVSASAAEPTYWQDVRPILRKNCTVCHNERKLDEPDVSAGLALNTPALIRKGGKVPILTPGKPDESLIGKLLTTTDPKRRLPL